jgi:hypothetical protein
VALLTIAPPALEPVTTAQLISYGHIDANEDASLLAMLISAAREWAEAFCERAFVFQTKRLLMDFFPGYVDFKMAGQRVSSPFVSGSNAVLVGIRYAVALPWPIARSVVNFQYQDENGNIQVMAAGTDFIVDLDSQPARLMPLFGQMWPVARVVANAVQVDYVTGYSGPIMVSVTAGSAVLTSSAGFLQRDVGAPISIPKAADGVAPFVTSILSVDANGVATLAAMAPHSASLVTTTFGTIPMSVQLAILALAATWYEKRVPDNNDVPFGVKALLYPYRDLRL